MLDVVKKRLRLINVIGAAAVVSLLAGTAALGVMPMLGDRSKSIRDAGELTANLSELDVLKLKVARVQEEQKFCEVRLKDAESRLPSVEAVNQFVPDLAKVAEEAGLQVNNVAPTKDPRDSGDYKLMSVQVQGTGDWETCYKFLTGLRAQNRKLTRLDGLRLEVDHERSTSEKTVCRITVDISTFLAR
jgi:Tfp pilus assembly protein PilO